MLVLALVLPAAACVTVERNDAAETAPSATHGATPAPTPTPTRTPAPPPAPAPPEPAPTPTKSPAKSPTPSQSSPTTATEETTRAPATATGRGSGDCAAYEDSAGWCEEGVEDYDCAGGTGDGPNYVPGPVTLVDPDHDPFDLDRDNDGLGCETSTPSPSPESAPAPEADTDPRFDTCGDAVAAGYGPYRQDEDPEYDWYRDADGDGVVCER